MAHPITRDLSVGVIANTLVAAVGFWAAESTESEHLSQIITVITCSVVVAALFLFIYFRIFRRYAQIAFSFESRSEDLHDLAHDTRDLIIHCGSPAPSYIDALPSVASGNKPEPHPGMKLHAAQIEKMLEDVRSLFQHLAPTGTKVWAALRDRRADDSYHTFMRVGRYTRARETNSVGLHKEESVVVKRLRESFRKQKCVVITGSKMGSDWWEAKPNDALDEDLSVMMGTVMMRAWNGNECIYNKHVWILTISANKEGVFDEIQIPLMKACNDMFSAAANAIARDYQIEQGGAGNA